jgi:pyruvate kinase
VQANLPLLTSRDKRAIADIIKEFDIDFVALTHTQGAEDVVELRHYLQSLGHESIKVIAKVPPPPPKRL